MSSYSQTSTDRKIIVWLFIVLLMVIAMVVLGGATRLTNSGLSITEWKPITGALPPLSHEAWMAEFEKYKQIPEFSAEHPDMDLKGFEFIYFMEWSHRQLGRMIGLVYGLPFLWLAVRGRLPKGKFMRFFGILLMIGFQGFIGWWMVHSGLSGDAVDVSQYRLATHLGIAFIIIGTLYWTWRDQVDGWALRRARPVFKTRTTVLAALVFLQVLGGAIVAGTHSGKTYNTWPLMDGGVIPGGYWTRSPMWRNLFENSAAIQFNHRILAYVIFVMAIWVFIKARKHHHLRSAAITLKLLIVWQVCLGIWTLLHAAPLGLSLVHQFSSILVFLAAVWLMRAARRGH